MQVGTFTTHTNTFFALNLTPKTFFIGSQVNAFELWVFPRCYFFPPCSLQGGFSGDVKQEAGKETSARVQSTGSAGTQTPKHCWGTNTASRSWTQHQWTLLQRLSWLSRFYQEFVGTIEEEGKWLDCLNFSFISANILLPFFFLTNYFTVFAAGKCEINKVLLICSVIEDPSFCAWGWCVEREIRPGSPFGFWVFRLMRVATPFNTVKNFQVEALSNSLLSNGKLRISQHPHVS